VDWELFSQGESGAIVTLRMPDGYDFGALEDRLTDLGYTPPDDKLGVWRGGDDLLAELGAGTNGLTPELNHIALDADAGLVFTSDDSEYLAQELDGDRGVPGLDDVVDASGDPLSASIYTGDYACEHLAMSQADATDQAQGDELIAAAGKVNPMTGFATYSSRCRSRPATRRRPTPTLGPRSPTGRRPARAATSPTGTPSARSGPTARS
jgi:hypothetical protein